ncbi:LysE family translocator [Corynebacterium pseudogenitalium]|uniref:LysE family translocator n=1 Tax=Corynebacterium pseudogenitalium TaxID=38303 RepID=UPI00210B1526|nr:LysE family translocator [Corynebacterium pseudogenitalium]UUA87861.1 LysE family translocator [Corynebacterium pseudogenitalium]
MPVLVDVLTWATVMAIPGPDIEAIGTQTSRYGQRAGFWTALGAMLGVATWSILALLGIEALLHVVPALSVVLPLAGSVALMLLGAFGLWGSVKAAKGTSKSNEEQEVVSVAARTAGASVRLGYVTNISNPKALVFFTSFFTPMMSHYDGLAEKLSMLGLLLGVTLLVFSAMSVLIRVAAKTQLRNIPGLQYLPGIIFLGIGLFYFVETLAK